MWMLQTNISNRRAETFFFLLNDFFYSSFYFVGCVRMRIPYRNKSFIWLKHLSLAYMYIVCTYLHCIYVFAAHVFLGCIPNAMAQKFLCIELAIIHIFPTVCVCSVSAFNGYLYQKHIFASIFFIQSGELCWSRLVCVFFVLRWRYYFIYCGRNR